MSVNLSQDAWKGEDSQPAQHRLVISVHWFVYCLTDVLFEWIWWTLGTQGFFTFDVDMFLYDSGAYLNL